MSQDGRAVAPRIVLALDSDYAAEYLTVRTERHFASVAGEVVLATHVDVTSGTFDLAGSEGLVVREIRAQDVGRVLSVPTLRVVAALAADRFIDAALLEQLSRAGVTYLDATNGSSPSVAEWALALILNALRTAGPLYLEMLEGAYRNAPTVGLRYEDAELRGKRVGLVGFGHIGISLTKLLAPFRCEVRAYDPGVSPRAAATADVRLARSLETLFAWADIVISTAPLTEQTRGMVTPDIIDLLPVGGVFVNVGRGATVDTDGLVDLMLSRRADLRVALDVLDPEPMPEDASLRAVRPAFLSPHIAGVTARGRERCLEIAIDEVLAILGGWCSSIEVSAAQVMRSGRG